VSEAEVIVDEERSGPGAVMRRAREQLGLSDQQVAEQLNLDVSIVSALESDDYPALGAPVFAKGHLRRYAGLLGLPPADLVEAYERSSGHLPPPSLIPRARVEMIPERAAPKWPWIVGGALAVVFAAAVVGYVSEYGLTLPGRHVAGSDGAAGTAPAASLPTEPVAPPETANVVSGGESATPAGAGAVVDAATDQLATSPVPDGHVRVGLSFEVDSWVEIYDGSGQAVLYDLGRAGSSRIIAAAAPLSVTLGNAAGVRLLVNGRQTPLPAVPAGQSVARFTIEPDGTLR